MKKIIKINIAKDFTVYPGARYRSDGDNSGEEFYEKILKPKFSKVWKNSDSVILIDFDGTFGYASSFISEVFTRLVEDFKDKRKIKQKLEYKTEDEPLLKDTVLQIIDTAETT